MKKKISRPYHGLTDTNLVATCSKAKATGKIILVDGVALSLSALGVPVAHMIMIEHKTIITLVRYSTIWRIFHK